jgi:hypothetical protein
MRRCETFVFVVPALHRATMMTTTTTTTCDQVEAGEAVKAVLSVMAFVVKPLQRVPSAHAPPVT